MRRILMTWELGMNLGHLARLLPIATKLKAQGHAVLVAARDVATAATVLGPAGISFIQAPHLPKGIPLAHLPTGYADILLSQGWANRETLWGLTQSWINLYRMFRPDMLVLDYSPTARLAAHIVQLPCVLIGNGFELPPATDPLPAFPNFSWASSEKAAESEQLALANAKAVASTFRAPGIIALRELLEGQGVLFATFPELDHYGARADATYIGPLLGNIKTERIDWPQGKGSKIFAALRPDTPNVEEILGALHQSEARVVCFAPGFPKAKLDSYGSPKIRFTHRPVDLKYLAKDADLCVSYAAEGTVATFLLAGVPQMVSPWQVEAHLAARALERMGVGLSLQPQQTAEQVVVEIQRITHEASFKTRVDAFRRRHEGLGSEQAVDEVLSTLGIGNASQQRQTVQMRRAAIQH